MAPAHFTDDARTGCAGGILAVTNGGGSHRAVRPATPIAPGLAAAGDPVAAIRDKLSAKAYSHHGARRPSPRRRPPRGPPSLAARRGVPCLPFHPPWEAHAPHAGPAFETAQAALGRLNGGRRAVRRWAGRWWLLVEEGWDRCGR